MLVLVLSPLGHCWCLVVEVHEGAIRYFAMGDRNGFPDRDDGERGGDRPQRQER
jgi:hypothetical protein